LAVMTSAVDNGLDEDYVEIERRLKIAQVSFLAYSSRCRGVRFFCIRN